jgi:hypothetical protein
MSKEMSESTVWDPKRFVTPLTEMIASVPSGSLGCGAVAPGPVTGADTRSVGTLLFVERAARGRRWRGRSESAHAGTLGVTTFT